LYVSLKLIEKYIGHKITFDAITFLVTSIVPGNVTFKLS
jgi:hypothetical protein